MRKLLIGHNTLDYCYLTFQVTVGMDTKRADDYRNVWEKQKINLEGSSHCKFCSCGIVVKPGNGHKNYENREI